MYSDGKKEHILYIEVRKKNVLNLREYKHHHQKKNNGQRYMDNCRVSVTQERTKILDIMEQKWHWLE